MSPLNVRGAALGVVGLVVLVAACGSSSSSKPAAKAATSSSKPTPAASGATSKDLCTVISPDDAATVFGESAQPKPSANPEPLVSGICLYHHEGDDLTVRNLLQIRVYKGEQFYGERLFPNRKALSGIGDKAFEDVSTTRHKVDIQFVKDGKTGTINYTTGASADVGSRVPALVAIAKKLAASM